MKSLTFILMDPQMTGKTPKTTGVEEGRGVSQLKRAPLMTRPAQSVVGLSSSSRG